MTQSFYGADGKVYVRVADQAYDGDLAANKVYNISYNQGVGADSVQEVAPALFQTIKVTLQDAITATATGAAVNASLYNKHTFFVNIGTTGTVLLQGSFDNTTWVTIADDKYGNDISSGVAADGIYQIEGKFPYVRANVTAVSGALTVEYFGGN